MEGSGKEGPGMDEESHAAGWIIFGVLFGFKMITAIMVFLMAPALGSAIFLVIFHWFWMIPLGVVGCGAFVAWWRLVRVRSRRERLRRAEFLIEETPR
jgi:hypothetical protein